jgi:hypothetical protein
MKPLTKFEKHLVKHLKDIVTKLTHTIDIIENGSPIPGEDYGYSVWSIAQTLTELNKQIQKEEIG